MNAINADAFCLLPVAADNVTCDEVCCLVPPNRKMDNDKDGVLGRKFHFNKLPDGSLEKQK